jgi:uncharacterized repeat protein (TIGR01451 family)
MKSKGLLVIVWALALPFLAEPALAQQGEQPQPLVITAQNLMAGDARHDELAARGGDRTALLPGDVVLYRLIFTNTTDAPVRNVEFKDPLPAGLRYVAGSAAADREDVSIAYSIDGGRTYSAEPTIEVVVDGERVMRPAPPEMYTHIRWLVTGWVQPGAQVTAEFRAQLPAAEAQEEPGEPN